MMRAAPGEASPNRLPTADSQALPRADQPDLTARDQILTAPVGLALRGLAAPMLVGLLFIGSLGVVEGYFVAKLDTVALAAFGFAVPVATLIANLVMGFGVGATSCLARSIGAQDQDKTARLLRAAALLTVAFTVLLTVASIATVEPLFSLLGASPAELPWIASYMVPWSGLLFTQSSVIVGSAILRAAGETRSSAVLFILAAFLNLLAAPLLILGAGPVPRLGLQGAALAVSVSFACAAILMLRYLKRSGLMLRLSDRAPLTTELREILRVSLPAMATYALVPASTVVITYLVARHGSAAVAAFGIANRVQMLCLMVPLGVGSALSSFVGLNWGGREFARVRSGVALSSVWVVAWGVVIALLVLLFAAPLARNFTDALDVEDALTLSLRLMALAFAPAGFVMIVGSTLNAVDRALQATTITFLRSIGFTVPLAWFGGAYFGLVGTLVGSSLGVFLAGLVAILGVSYTLRTEP